MAKQAKLKCLRCGYEYTATLPDNPYEEERTCPKCRSNSVRLLPEEKRGA